MTFFSLKYPVGILFLFAGYISSAQRKLPPERTPGPFISVKEISATEVKNQGNTGTCWSFSGTSLLESEFISSHKTDIDLSEMFTVRNIYMEKARNYVLRQGKAQFSQGALGHDVIRSVALYGAMPDRVYSGLVNKTFHDHSLLADHLKAFLDSVIHNAPRPLSPEWENAYVHILDDYLGKVPESFDYNGEAYSPKSFALEILKFNPSAYVNITSFTHHPYYEPFILEVPDNFSNGSYYNVPLTDLTEVVRSALQKGFSVMWDADVSNDNFRHLIGLAIVPDPDVNTRFDPTGSELSCDAMKRQRLFEGLETQDDHLMHITGLEKLVNGKTFFKVKNSWGNVGPYDGYVLVSENYFLQNTIGLVVPKAAISHSLAEKLRLH